MELYKDRDTQVLISKFLSGEITEIQPAYDPKRGYMYPKVDAIIGNASDSAVFLEKLYNAGILERRLFDKIIICPKSNSANVSVHYCCPYCKSFDIQKSSLVEHVKCGYMDIEENFRKSGRLVCPKCGDELVKIDVDHRRAGIWCKCKDCGKNFDIPVAELFCRECHHNFTFEDAIIKDVHAYFMKEEAKHEAAVGWILVAPVKEFFTEIGLEAEGPAFLKGKSGASHMFDIVAKTRDANRNVTVVDLATTSESSVSEQPVIALFAKIFDVSPSAAYLIAIPKMSENAKRMAELYNIRVVEAKDNKETIRALRETMKK